MKHRFDSWNGEICKCCGQPNHFSWSVSDEIWNSVAQSEYENSVLCLGCFDWLAWKIGIFEWIDTLVIDSFVGRSIIKHMKG